MQPQKCFFACIIIFLLLTLSSCSLPLPNLTLVSIMPPRDFDSVLIINDNIEIPSHRTVAAWETYDTFWLQNFYQLTEDSPIGIEIKTAVLRVTAHGETFYININTEVLDSRYNTVTLSIGNKSIMQGTPLRRDIPLISLRVILLLAVASGLFYLFGYRKKRSWIALYATCLPGAILISSMIVAGTTDPYRSTFPLFLLYFNIPVLLLTSLAMCIAVSEHNRIKTSLYVATSNIINYVLYLITQRFLPF